MKSSIYPNIDMKNSKFQLIFPYFFILIFILASISQKCLKKWVKKISLRFSWKLPHILILIWRIQKSKAFSHMFLSSFSFLPRLVEMSYKMGQKNFSRIFIKTTPYFNFDMENSKIEIISPYFSSSSPFFPRLVKNVLKNGSKIFFSDFQENCHTT